MDDAKFSLNLKFNWRGWDSQITLRADEDCNELIAQGLKVIGKLESLGAKGERRWENVRNGVKGDNGKEQPPPANQGKLEEQDPAVIFDPHNTPICRVCESSDDMELIFFERNGKETSAWKCQACDKWHYEKKASK